MNPTGQRGLKSLVNIMRIGQWTIGSQMTSPNFALNPGSRVPDLIFSDKLQETHTNAKCICRAVGQLAQLLWQVECTSVSYYSFCITRDHSTLVEYGGHSYEPVPFTISHLKDFVNTRGGELSVMEASLDPFNLTSVNGDLQDER